MRRLVIGTTLVAAFLAGCGGDGKPTATPPTGSCCVPVGTCTVTTQANCTGTWAQVGVCTPNPCVRATGSCCATDGTCAVTLQTACFGAWTMFSTCDPNPCVQPTGSCCAEAGTCTVTTQVSCVSPSLWHQGGDCDPNNCPEPPTVGGACCAPGGTCAITAQARCSGAWIVGGVCDPNPCTTMVWIPAGNVRLGQTGIAEPVNDVYVGGFWIDRFEVSNAKYKAFIYARGYTTEAYWNPVGWAWRVANSITLPYSWNSNTYHGGGIAGNEQFPVNGVSWFEADAYCRWAGGRLPTEAEWEKAAKGGCETHGDAGQCDVSDTPTYPWGEGLSGLRANYWQSGDPYEGYGWTTPVGYYDGSDHGGYQTIDSPSPYGLYDVAANAWEWCSTGWADYPYNPNDGRENPPVHSPGCCRVLRGGSWDSAHNLPCADRYGTDSCFRGNAVGFRCVRSE